MDSTQSFPLVTVVIPVFNQKAEFLRQCIESVLTQDYPNLEIIVSDNHSDNGSWEIISSYSDPRLKILRPAQHLPMVQHWAFATFQARGVYLSMMGSDDWAEPHWLKTMMSDLLRHPSASFAFPNLTLHSQHSGSPRVFRGPHITTHLIPSRLAVRDVVKWNSHMFSWWVVGAIIRSSDYFAVSGIARYATVHNGDYPLSLGLLTRGDALYIDSALTNYRIWGEEQGKSDGKRQAVILEDMARILACIPSDAQVHSLCNACGWPIGRIKLRFILLALFWIDLFPVLNGHSSEERKRIIRGLKTLMSTNLTLGIFLIPVFMTLKAVAHRTNSLRKWILKIVSRH